MVDRIGEAVTSSTGEDGVGERLVVVEALPRASGGKIAKGALRSDIRSRIEKETGTSR